MMQWTTGKAKKLIDEYRKRPELWDSKHDMYRVYKAKSEAWRELSAVLGCEVSEMRKKLNSLLASHRREIQRIRKGGSTCWFAYDRLNFLPSHLDDTSRKDREHEHTVAQDEDIDVNEEYLETEESSNDELSEELRIKREPSATSVTPPPVSPPPAVRIIKRPPVSTIRSVRRKIQKKPSLQQLSSPQSDSQLLDTLKSLRHSNLTVKKRDDCDIFGEYIANSLKKHDDRTQAMIKHAINNIIFEQEMKKYSANHFQMITVDDENPLVLTEQLDES